MIRMLRPFPFLLALDPPAADGESPYACCNVKIMTISLIPYGPSTGKEKE
jgi:hypothetical protein